MHIQLLPNVDVSYLDRLLIDEGLIWPVDAKVLAKIPTVHLRTWCVKHGVYQIPTWELIFWLEREINNRRAIEICAGKSCLGRHLGITMTDNYSHTWPWVRQYYKAMRQPPCIPDPDVEQMDANEAIRQYKPEVVIGSWVTQKWVGNGDGNMLGPDEHDIVANCTYIHIGNVAVHGKKRILIRPHRELYFPWLFGRGVDPKLNRIYVWDSANSR